MGIFFFLTRLSFLEARIIGIVKHVFQKILADVFFKNLEWNKKKEKKIIIFLKINFKVQG